MTDIAPPGPTTTTTAKYEEPRHVASLADCWFYHVMDLPGVGETRGQWDLRPTADAYLGGQSFAGRRALDLGAASGYLTFEMERRGADVVSFDIAPDRRWDLMPFRANEARRDVIAEEYRRVSESLKNSYWFAHRALGSRAKAFYGNVYDVPAAIGPFDVVLVGQILVHLRDPVQALYSAARHSTDLLIVTEGAVTLPLKLAVFYPDATLPQVNYQWWRLSVGTYRELFRALGFEMIQCRTTKHHCTVPGSKPWLKLTTMVGQRTDRPPTRSWWARAAKKLVRSWV